MFYIHSMPSHPKEDRIEYDNYSTPYWCIRALLDDYQFKTLDNRPLKIVEPCAGEGSISREIKRYYPHAKLIQSEIRQETYPILREFGSVQICNFLRKTSVDIYVTHVITNPPFSIAKEFVEHCMRLYPFAEIIMLLPFTFYGSADRYNFWKTNEPKTQWTLTDRPSFTGTGTDSSIYVWIGWKTLTRISNFRFVRNNYKAPYNKKAVQAYINNMYALGKEIIIDDNPQTFYKTVIKGNPKYEDEYRKLLTIP